MKLIIHDFPDEETKRGIREDPADCVLIGDKGTIMPCIGCFGCWKKTPGKCVVSDGYDSMGELIHAADEVIVYSRLTFGGFSGFVKNVFDRSLSYVLPHFELVEGESHHMKRYGETKDFSALIEQAKSCPPPTEIETGTIVGGFAHEQVFALADKVVEAVRSGAIRKFVVMGGCDGRHKTRDYYAEFAKKLPKDVVILTAGCAKYKYNKLDLGDIGGIPRVLDAGQCNDSYSLALIALKLKEVFGLADINDLPIAFNIAWYEQKAVIVLLALLHLGVKNIHLGPTLPAFLSPNVAKVLVENFGIAGIGTVDDDIKALVG